MEKVNYPLGKIGTLFVEHIKLHKPKMYQALKASGTLEKMAYDTQEETKIQLGQIEKDLRKKNPLPTTENYIEIVQYNQHIADTAWELAKENIYL